MAYLVAGRNGVRDLFSQVARWQVSPRWYAAALLLVPGLNAAAFLLYAPLGGQPYPLGSLAIALGVGFTSPLLEEFGWRGFALAELHVYFHQYCDQRRSRV